MLVAKCGWNYAWRRSIFYLSFGAEYQPLNPISTFVNEGIYQLTIQRLQDIWF
jgi:hypothetical protein